MIMYVSCVTCEEEYSFDLTDDLYYEFTCSKGHENVFFIKRHKFELLFKMGLFALCDGYYREAASNFAAAIERFHEFCINVFSCYNGQDSLQIADKIFRVNDSKFESELDESWRELARQSERQYGAYIMLYLITFKRHPQLMKRKSIEFRNNIVHKGAFPDKGRTTEYAKGTYDYIHSKFLELKKEIPEITEHVYSREIRKFRDDKLEIYNGKTLVTYLPNTPFGVERSLEALINIDFEEAKMQAMSERHL
ncbi:hypothetical protein JI735_19460 [Paenibacillus sonchi]|uniref:Uncharacterized protein n=1 Tax=Paenibacillus sonchi TaxID=373687 RepID=A0A974P8M0_9BACL|nr:hypothetical protein [Paenibacillus sonchi]QQZ58911.1 hypothetical protein JI735_19460 [Paenibacillus sonchi]